MVLWELVTRMEPYHGVPVGNIAAFVLSGGRPEIPANVSETMQQLMRRCWDVRAPRCVRGACI